MGLYCSFVCFVVSFVCLFVLLFRLFVLLFRSFVLFRLFVCFVCLFVGSGLGLIWVWSESGRDLVNHYLGVVWSRSG